MGEIKIFKRFTLGIPALAGISVLFVTTEPWGIGLSPDSVAYLTTARDLLAGRGADFIQWPPLFPLLLSLIGRLGLDPLEGARALNLILFGANIFLMGLVLEKSTGSLWISILGSLLTASSPCMLYIHSMALSEPLFIFFGFLGLFLLARYLGSGENRSPALLGASSVSIALAFFSRYAGISLVGTGVAALFLLSRSRLQKKMTEAAFFITISSLPTLLWLLRNVSVAPHYPTLSRLSQTAVGLPVVFHPFTFDHLRYALHTLSTWLVPGTVPRLLRGTVLLAAGVGLVGMVRVVVAQGKKDPLSLLLAAFVVCYVLTVVLHIIFLGVKMPLDDRALSPLFFAGMILVLCSAHQLRSALRGVKIARSFVAALFMGLAFSYFLRSTAWALAVRREGQGYEGKAWKASELIQEIRALPPGTPIYTNASDAVYTLTGRRVSDIPTRKVLLKGNPEEELVKKEGFLVYFNRITWRWYYPSESELQKRLPLRPVKKTADGSLYRIDG